jgi:23S rRNA pseudouridine2604 synthase
MTEPVRLAKRLAQQMGCSRSVAEQYIEGGWVEVDGVLVEEPMARVTDAQNVVVDPNATLIALAPMTLLLHVPPEYAVNHAGHRSKGQDGAFAMLTAENRFKNDRSGVRAIKKHFAQQQVVASLDFGACGLAIWTQDFRVGRKLYEDAQYIEHEYMVDVDGVVSPAALLRLSQPFTLQGRRLPAVRVSVSSARSDGQRSTLRFAIKGPAPQQIAIMCELVELPVRSIKRSRVGSIALQQLPAGQWRYLATHERF